MNNNLSEDNRDNETFSYSYSAPTSEERKQIESIRKQYIGGERTGKLERLERLDKKVKRVPQIVALVMGVGGILVFGLGISLSLSWHYTVLGAIVAAIGVVPMSLAYYVHSRLLKRRKELYRQEILSLSEELLGEKDS